jgi:hypothetical protein
LIRAFDELLAQAGPVCRQERTRQRLRSHLLAQLACLGRHTLTGLLCAGGRPFADWSADYRLYAHDRVDPSVLFDVVRQEVQRHLRADQPLVVALDDSILRKRGRKIPGTAWRVDPLGAPFAVSFTWAQRVIQMSVALPVGPEGAARTLPIDFVQAPTPQRPRKQAPENAWQEYRKLRKELNINRQALKRVNRLAEACSREASGRPLWLSVDGRFTNSTMLKHLPHGQVLIGRIRGDAKFHGPAPAVPTGGRPRQYGPRLPTPEQLRADDSIPWSPLEAFAAGKRHNFRLKTLAPVKWRPAGLTAELRLIVIAPLGYRLSNNSRKLYRKPAYLICTDPSLPLEQVLQAYLWRWGIEVNFRDEKTLIGVGQAQLRNPTSVNSQPATSVAAYALLLAAAARAYGPDGIPDALPPPAWRASLQPHHASTASLINQLRHELWAPAITQNTFSGFLNHAPDAMNPQKLHPDLASAVFYAIAG